MRVIIPILKIELSYYQVTFVVIMDLSILEAYYNAVFVFCQYILQKN